MPNVLGLLIPHHQTQQMLTLTLGLTCALTLVSSVINPPPACAEEYHSRLSQLIQQKPNLYKPTRFFIGEDNKVVVKAPAGNTVVLTMSPTPGETAAPNGKPLRVNPSHETLEMVASDKGVAVFQIPVPNDSRLEGQSVYLDGYTYKSADYSDLALLSLLDATGHPTDNNRLGIEVRANGEGTMLLPGMAGMDNRMLQRLSTLGEVTGDDRKKELVDDGNMNRNTTLDRNAFVRRADGTVGIGQ